MVSFATFNDLRSFSKSIRETDEKVILKEASRTIIGKTVFLSHSSKDKEYLSAVVSILEKHGGNVYVDSGDNRLPETPNRKLAEVLRDTIQFCRKFVLFVTINSKDSKWIPWELGLADGEKGHNQIALFPTSNYSYEQLWLATEYLGLYQRIVWGRIQNATTSNTWIVLNYEKNTAQTLSQWLKEGS